MPFALMLQAENAAPQTGLGSLIIMVGFMFAIFYFIVIRPQRARERQRLEMLSKIKKNDHVLTSGGIYGTVMNVKDEEVSLRIDDGNNVRVRVTRSSIVSVVGPKDEKEKE